MSREKALAVAASVVLHLLLLGGLAFTMWERPRPPATNMNKPIIQARAVDEETAMAAVRAREAEEQRKREAAERKRKAAEAEKRRRAEEKRKKAEAEKKRLAEEKRKQAEAEKKRLAEEKRKQAEAERKRREAEDKKRREEALMRQMAEEAERLAEEDARQHQAQLSRQQLQYVSDIQNKVSRNWLRPAGSTGTLCSVLINQIPSGDVVGVQVTDCDGDIAFKQSVERAVRKASPLPLPADPELFQREIEFVFTP